MLIRTESGSTYRVERSTTKKRNFPCFRVTRIDSKDGIVWDAECMAIYPDRKRFLSYTKRMEFVNGKLLGFDKNGTITIRVLPFSINIGMIFFNPTTGFESTKIVEIL